MKGKRITDINGLMYLWQVDNLYLAGQPSLDSWEQIKELGITKVINLRDSGEMDFTDEVEKLKNLGLPYEQFPIVVNGQLDGENCRRLNDMLNETDKFFIHCGSANRVAGWLMTYLTTKRGMDFDSAMEVSQENGLSNPGFIDQAEKIIKG